MKYDEFTTFNLIASWFFESIDKSLRQRHQLNNYLGFGFRKDDVVLDALKDRWTDEDHVPLSRLEFWFNRKFIPYLNHWCSLSERSENRRIATALWFDLDQLLRKIHDCRDDCEASVLEIKVAISMVVIDLMDASIRQWPDYDEYKNKWNERIDQLFQKEFGSKEIPQSEFYSPLRTLLNFNTNNQVDYEKSNGKNNDSSTEDIDEYSEEFKFVDQDILIVDFGLEIIDGMHTFFKALEKLPLTITQIFSTAEDNQKSITISFCVMFGNGVIEKIGTYELVNLPNAPKGVPQITIKITIDENLLILKAINENKKPIQILKK